MAAVIAVVDDQLFALAQTGQGRQLSLGGGDVLGHDAVLLAYDDPVPARPWHNPQAARWS